MLRLSSSDDDAFDVVAFASLSTDFLLLLHENDFMAILVIDQYASVTPTMFYLVYLIDRLVNIAGTFQRVCFSVCFYSLKYFFWEKAQHLSIRRIDTIVDPRDGIFHK